MSLTLLLHMTYISHMTQKTYIQIEMKNKSSLKGLAHAKIIKKLVILFRVLNMTI